MTGVIVGLLYREARELSLNSPLQLLLQTASEASPCSVCTNKLLSVLSVDSVLLPDMLHNQGLEQGGTALLQTLHYNVIPLYGPVKI